MNVCTALEDALNGDTPEITPFFVYDWLLGAVWNPCEPGPEWESLIERGLGVLEHVRTVEHIQHGVKSSTEEKIINGKKHRRHIKKTPIGTLDCLLVDGWETEYWVKCESDYDVYRWIVENTEIKPAYANYDRLLERASRNRFPLIIGTQTPMMDINLNVAGTERFCMDLAMEVPEMLALHNAMCELHRKEHEVIAKGPGRFVKWIDNVTISFLGPARYEQWLMPVYNEIAPLLDRAGKRLIIHYDGELRPILDQIRRIPVPVIEGVTEPPEGDMMYEKCRAAWPDKVIWGNVNMEVFAMSPELMRDTIRSKCARAGKRAFALELSEDIPKNWRDTMPVLLNAVYDV